MKNLVVRRPCTDHGLQRMGYDNIQSLVALSGCAAVILVAGLISAWLARAPRLPGTSGNNRILARTFVSQENYR
jgi:hypothetical protein